MVRAGVISYVDPYSDGTVDVGFTVRPSTTVTVDGAAGDASSLKPGQTFVMTGTAAAQDGPQTARTVHLYSAIDGEVESVDLAHARLVVLGQPLQVDGMTWIDDSEGAPNLGRITVGAHVRVSGLYTASGQIMATRIDHLAAGPHLERVAGIVRDRDNATLRFKLNDLVVDYSTAQRDGLGEDGSWGDGTIVQVNGALMGTPAILVASTLSRRADDPLPGLAGASVELLGIVTGTDAPQIDGRSIVLAKAGPGCDAILPDLGVLVTVEGTRSDAGPSITCVFPGESNSHATLVGPVQSVNSADGTLNVFGIPLLTRQDTLVGHSGSVARTAAIAVGDWVSANVTESATAGTAIAASITPLAQPQVGAEATLRSWTLQQPYIDSFGQQILITPDTKISGMGFSRQPVTADNFFTPGTLRRSCCEWDYLALTLTHDPQGNLVATSVNVEYFSD